MNFIYFGQVSVIYWFLKKTGNTKLTGSGYTHRRWQVGPVSTSAATQQGLVNFDRGFDLTGV